MAVVRAYSWIMWTRIHRRLGARPSGQVRRAQPLQAAIGQRLRDQGGVGRFQVKSMVSFSLHAKKRLVPPG
jgi:hypothetical protein